LWPDLGVESQALLEQYQALPAGLHRLHLFDGKITLSLLIGDVLDTLPQLNAKVDAWFLDGFAPAKNPDMWQAPLFAQMARLSNTSATFATFTSAGVVKRGLAAAGFNVCKASGYGRKREMLYGTFLNQASL
ncbi:MAG TPA: tRNA (5-methylaminomethyl-2-thiouridine)(34)-methyltransferase MnmD, partial [Methylophilus sp.]